MLKMLRYMKTQWKTVIAIIVLLFVQAICDLSLPTYTSNLIDVGIQNSGVEFATPTVIRAQEYQKVQLFMTEDEKTLWNAAYEQGSDGNFHIKDESRKNMQQLDDTFTHPILITYMLSHMSTDQQVAAASTTEAGGTPDYAAIRSSVEDKMQSMGETMLHSSAVAYAKEEYTAVGKDLNQMQTAYLWKIGGVMIGMALLMAVSAVLVGLLASRVGAGVGRDLREQVFNRVVGFSHAEINHFSTASLITRSTNDIQQM